MRSLLRGIAAVAVTVAAVSPTTAQSRDPGRLYGRVVTMDGTTLVGFIRWDNNEGHWTDQLDATKRLPRRFRLEAERLSGERYEVRRPVRVLGVRVGWDTSSRWSNTASSAIRFGHIRQIQVLDRSHGLLVLKSGEEQELSSSSSDLGAGLEIIVAERAGSAAELSWDDIDFVEFQPAPRGSASPFGERLFGTVTTRGGDAFTGWITWDRDELYGADELNGQAAGRRRNIAFDNIASIAQRSSSRALVTLRNGEAVEMSGTNDVNSQNRGIFISDPGLGRVEVKWGELDDVRFHAPPADLSYDEFDGGHRLVGTVWTEDGRRLTGMIRWDNDEEWTWEVLNGNYDDLVFHIEFGLITAIERTSAGARVTVLDGREFPLRGSNDVSGDNKGIFVRSDDGEAVMVTWDELRRVEFQH